MDAGLTAAVQKGIAAAQGKAEAIAPVPEQQPEGDADDGDELEEGAQNGEVQTEGEEAKAPDAKEGEPATEPKGPIPYERFQEVVKARQEVESQVKEMEPIVTAYRGIEEFCQTNQITQDEFSNVLEVLALSKRDPAAALAKFTPTLESWKGFTGEKLDPDLAEAVQAQEISERWARETQKARTQANFARQQGAKTAEQQQRAAQQAQTDATLTSFSRWLEPLQKADPNFKQGNTRFDLFLDRLRGAVSQTGAQTPQSIVKHAQEALDYVTKALKKSATPAVNGANGHKPVLRTNASATSTSTRGVVPKFKTIEEAVAYGVSNPGRPRF